MKHRFITGLGVFLLLAAAASAVIWTQVTPMYVARAELQVAAVIPGVLDEDRTVPFYESFVNTQVSIVRSPTVLQRVLDREDVRQTRWFREPAQSLVEKILGSQAVPMERLRENLSVRPRARTEIIDISFAARSGAEAQLIVNAVLDEYIEFSEQRRDATQEDLYKKLVTKHDLLQKRIEMQEKVCASLRKELRTGSPEELIETQRVRLEDLEDRLSRLNMGIAMLQREIERKRSRDSHNASEAAPREHAAQPMYHEDAQWCQLDLEVLAKEHELTKGRYSSNHPDMTEAKEDLEFAKELRRRREAQLDEQWHARAQETPVAPAAADDPNHFASVETSDSLSFRLEQAMYLKQMLTKQQADLRQAFEKLLEAAGRLEEQKTELRHQQELRDAIRDRIEARRLERLVPPRIGILTRAFTPSKPDQDRRMLFTAIALAGALLLGALVALLGRRRQGTTAGSQAIR